MPNFDPSILSATLDFVDGATTVDANFLSAVPVRVASVADACDALVSDGDVATVVQSALTTRDGSVVAEFDLGASSLFALDGCLVFKVGSTGYDIEVRDARDLISTGRDFTTSWATGSIAELHVNGRYLVAISDNTTKKIDIWDLSDDSLVGTYIWAGTRSGDVIHRGRIFMSVDNTGGKVLAIDLATATLDASFGTAGVATASYFGSISADDFRIVVGNGLDAFQGFDHDGASQWDMSAVVGDTTTNALILLNDGTFITAGDTYIGRISSFDGVRIERFAHGTAFVGGQHGCAIMAGWFAVATSGGFVNFYNLNQPAKWLISGDTNWNEPFIRSDGVDLLVDISIAAGAMVNGIARVKGLNRAVDVQRLGTTAYGRPPYNELMVRPIQ